MLWCSCLVLLSDLQNFRKLYDLHENSKFLLKNYLLQCFLIFLPDHPRHLKRIPNLKFLLWKNNLNLEIHGNKSNQREILQVEFPTNPPFLVTYQRYLGNRFLRSKTCFASIKKIIVLFRKNIATNLRNIF